MQTLLPEYGAVSIRRERRAFSSTQTKLPVQFETAATATAFGASSGTAERRRGHHVEYLSDYRSSEKIEVVQFVSMEKEHRVDG